MVSISERLVNSLGTAREGYCSLQDMSPRTASTSIFSIAEIMYYWGAPVLALLCTILLPSLCSTIWLCIIIELEGQSFDVPRDRYCMCICCMRAKKRGAAKSNGRRSRNFGQFFCIRHRCSTSQTPERINSVSSLGLREILLSDQAFRKLTIYSGTGIASRDQGRQI